MLQQVAFSPDVAPSDVLLFQRGHQGEPFYQDGRDDRLSWKTHSLNLKYGFCATRAFPTHLVKKKNSVRFHFKFKTHNFTLFGFVVKQKTFRNSVVWGGGGTPVCLTRFIAKRLLRFSSQRLSEITGINNSAGLMQIS